MAKSVSSYEKSAQIDFGKKFRYLRTSYGINQTDLAKLVGFNQTYISNVESGRKRASDRFLRDAAKVFQVHTDTLIAIRELTLAEAIKDKWAVAESAIDSLNLSIRRKIIAQELMAV